MESTSFTIVLPVPCLNTVYRAFEKRVYKSAKAKLFDQYVKDTFKRATLMKGPLIAEIRFYIDRDCDIDSKLKVLLDSLEGVIYENDSQIEELHVVKVRGVKADIKTTVKISQLLF